MKSRRPLTEEERLRLERKRTLAAENGGNVRKSREKPYPSSKGKKKKSSKKRPSNSKIADAVNLQKNNEYEDISREEKFRIESEEKIRRLEPRDFDDGGYYIDEFSARRKQERRAKEIHKQETEVIYRRKKPVTPKQNRRRKILMYCVFFFVILILGLTLSLTVLFKTEKIVVEGDEYYYDDQIIAFSNVELQQNIILGALFGTPQTIVDYLPFVEDAEISFKIPDTVTISITDAVPAYVICRDENYLLISAKGRILEQIEDNSENFPELICDDLQSYEIGDYVSFGDKNIAEALVSITDSISTNGFEGITSYDVTDTANITLNYEGRIKINIGVPEDIDYKIRTAMTIINDKLDPNDTGAVYGTLDVSACSTTKISHYTPDGTTATAASSSASESADSSDSSDNSDSGEDTGGNSEEESSEDSYGESADSEDSDYADGEDSENYE